MERNSIKLKMKNVFKRYGYYMLLGVMLIGVVLTIVLVGANGVKKSNVDSTPTSSSITPYMPVLNASIYKGYYGDELVYNSTLKQWETHNGIDFTAASGSKVYSILDGVIVDVYSNILEGSVVVVEHADGIVSTYGSLDENVSVKEGDRVNRGQELGSISTTSSSEVDAGAHLHFAMTDNGNKIDPAAYLNIQTKW